MLTLKELSAVIAMKVGMILLVTSTILSFEIVEYIDRQTDKDLKHQYLKCILLTLKELSAVIAMKVGVILLVTSAILSFEIVVYIDSQTKI